MNRPRVVIYTRVSTEDQADYGTGLETQEIECRRYAERIGAAVVARESDPGISGTIYPRAGLDRALALLESGQADILLVHRVDRIGRKAYIPMLINERIKAGRGRLFTVLDGEVTDQNILMFSLRCGLAQTDYTTIVNNMTTGKRRRAEAGQTPSRVWSPYGYRIVRKGEEMALGAPAGSYLIVPEEADVVREIFTRYAAGSSMTAICKELQQRGVPTPKASKATKAVPCWETIAVSRLLSCTAYKGYVEWGKTQAVTVERHSFTERLQRGPQGPKTRRFVPTPAAARVRIECPVIVDPALWERCQQQRERNKQETNGVRNDRKHRFAGLVFCPECRRRMCSARDNRHGKTPDQKPVIYRCHDHAPSQNAAGIVCHRRSYKEEEIRAYVRRLFEALVNTPEFLRAAIEVHRTQEQSGYDAKAHADIIEQLRALDAREVSVAESYTRAIEIGTRPEAFENMLKDIVLKRRELIRRKEAMEALLLTQRQQDPQDLVSVVQSYAQDLIEAIDNDALDTARLNAALRRVIRQVMPTQEGYQVVLESIYIEEGASEASTCIVMQVSQARSP